MGDMIEFARPDGKTCPAYEVVPDAGRNAPGIVIIQEYWGLNPQIKKTGDRVAALGFRALVPDLFRGKVAKDSDEASHLMQGLNFGDAASQDIAGAVAYLKKGSPKVAVGGFCMGGALAILAALFVQGMDAGFCYYGIPPAAFADPSKITIPMIYHFATHDDWCNASVVGALEQAIAKCPAPHPLYRYDAQHAFMNEARPEVFAPEAAKTSWDRTIQFLKTSLG